MMRQQRSLTVALLLAAAAPTAAQTTSEPDARYRMLLRTGQRLEGAGMRLMADRIEVSGRSAPVPFGEIRSLEVATSTKKERWAVAGAAIGAGSFLLVAAINAAVASSSKDVELVQTGALIGAGTVITLGGAIGGAVLGGRTPNWRTIPVSQSRAAAVGPQRWSLTLVRIAF